jgi:hypothetical protein
MSKKGSSASSDPMAQWSAMMQAQSAAQQTQLGQNWLNFAQQQFGIANERQKGIDALTNQVTQAQITGMNNANQWASEDRARYKSVFQPLQDKFIDKANNWDSAGKQAEAAAEAKADVTNNAALQDQQRTRQMAAMGVNPTSGRFAGVERAADTETALAGAGAQNNARTQLRSQAMGLQGDAVNMGNGLPAQASQSLGLGSNIGGAAEAGALGAEGNFRSNIGIMNSGFQGAGSLFNSAGNMYGNVYNGRVNMLNQQDQMQNQGWGSLLGGAGSLLGMFMSDEDAKEDKREVKGVLDALKSMPVEAWKYKEGKGDGGEHIGAYAQDFQRATGLGDGKTISVIDALGVTMGAVKELAEKVEAGKGKSDGDEKPAARTAAHRPAPKGKSIIRMAA